MLAMVPSYGLNSVFLGGDSRHGDPDWAPWNSPARQVAAETISQVKNPGQIIVFAATTRSADGSWTPPAALGIEPGYVQLQAPYVYDGDTGRFTDVDLWEYSDDGAFIEGATGGGWPTDRLNDSAEKVSIDRVPVARLDGSTASESPSVMLGSLRNWSPFQTGVAIGTRD